MFVSHEWRITRLQNNYLLERDDEEYLVINSRVFEELNPLFEQIKRGEFPQPNGVLLLGPPGTGKTALVNALAEIHGVQLITVRPDNVLGSLLGESERNMREAFERARASEPCVLFFDECDWFAVSRSLGGSRQEAEKTIKNVLTVFFLEMQRLTNERRKILVIAATNYREDLLDPAFRREGRVGKKIFVPPPDREAIEIAMKRELGYVDENLLRTMLSAAEGMSNVRGWLREKREGKEPRIGGGSRGYRRLIHPSPVELKYISRRIPTKGFARIFLRGPYPIMKAIVANIYTYQGISAIEITEDDAYLEAVNVAEQTNSPIIVSTDMHPEYQKRLDKAFSGVVVMCGTKEPEISAAYLFSLSDAFHIEDKERISRAVLAFYGKEGKAESEEELIVKTLG